MKLLDALLIRGQEQWGTRTGLLLVLLAVCGSLLVAFATFDLSDVSRLEWSLIVFVCLLIVSVWWQGRVKPVPKGKVGIGVAIRAEKNAAAEAFRQDFASRLKTLVSEGGLMQRLEFRELAISDRVLEDSAALTKLMIRTNVHFLLTGSVRTRSASQSNVGVMDISGVVRHVVLPEDVKRSLGREFRQMMPGRVVVPEGEFVLVEVAAIHIEAVARCIIGLAAAVSGDLAYAETILLDAELRTKTLLKNGERSVLLGRVQAHLMAVMNASLARAGYAFTVSRDKGELAAADAVAGRLLERDATHYNALLTAAIADFLLRNDKPAAFERLNRCKGRQDATWKFSVAFLEAYDGDLSAAYKSYRAALESPLHDDLVIPQVEQFLQGVLEEEPHRYWLYFCLGLINYRAKGDLVAAEADLRSFLEAADSAIYKPQIEAAEKWLSEISAQQLTAR